MKAINKVVSMLMACGGLLLAVSTAQADLITKPHTFSAGTPAKAEEVNANFDKVYEQVNKVGAAVTVDNANNVGIGTTSPTAKVDVEAGIADSYGPWIDYDAYYNPCLHCADTCNNNDWLEFSCPDGQSINCEDIRQSDGEYWQYRLVECDKPQQAGRFDGHVDVDGDLAVTGLVSGDGSGLTNVTAKAIAVDCPYNYVLQKDVNGWHCVPFCQEGDFVNCYQGAAGTLNVGVCAAGVRSCIGGSFGNCTGQVLSTAEDCGPADKDCDGDPDNYATEGAPGCTWFYPDVDQDNYGDMHSAPLFCKCFNPDPHIYANNNSDCLDSEYSVQPGQSYQAEPYGSPPSWDWNCSGQIEKQYTDTNATDASCVLDTYGTYCVGSGWIGSTVPDCGETAAFWGCNEVSTCHGGPTTMKQMCK